METSSADWRLDHFVLTVKDIQVTREFYSRVLGIGSEYFGNGRVALRIGGQKINLHQAGLEVAPFAGHPTPGAGDFCLITSEPLQGVAERIRACRVEIVEGPVRRTGAAGPIRSLYLRDPDGNLVEVANSLGEEG